MVERRRVLGKGLSALIQAAGGDEPESGLQVREIPLAEIGFNPHQPRKEFDDEKLAELADSIRQVGILQPVLVREVTPAESRAIGAGVAGGPVHWVVVAGERRVRAARLADLLVIPAIPCTYAETEALKVALLENIQRQDLGAIEEAQAYQELLDSYGATQDEVATMLGKNRSTIANALRLLTLEESIRNLVQGGKLSRGHAKAILGLPPGPDRQRLARLCVSRGLSVRECERRVQAAAAGTSPRRNRKRGHKGAAAESPAVRGLRERAEAHFGSPVVIQQANDGKGEVRVAFYSDRDLERVLAMMGVEVDLG